MPKGTAAPAGPGELDEMASEPEGEGGGEMSDDVRAVQRAIVICIEHGWPVPQWLYLTLSEAVVRRDAAMRGIR